MKLPTFTPKRCPHCGAEMAVLRSQTAESWEAHYVCETCGPQETVSVNMEVWAASHKESR